jgi:hypothetical protein
MLSIRPSHTIKAALVFKVALDLVNRAEPRKSAELAPGMYFIALTSHSLQSQLDRNFFAVCENTFSVKRVGRNKADISGAIVEVFSKAKEQLRSPKVAAFCCRNIPYEADRRISILRTARSGKKQ